MCLVTFESFDRIKKAYRIGNRITVRSNRRRRVVRTGRRAGLLRRLVAWGHGTSWWAWRWPARGSPRGVGRLRWGLHMLRVDRGLRLLLLLLWWLLWWLLLIVPRVARVGGKALRLSGWAAIVGRGRLGSDPHVAHCGGRRLCHGRLFARSIGGLVAEPLVDITPVPQ